MTEESRPLSVHPAAPTAGLAALTAPARRLAALGYYRTLFWGYVAIALVLFTFLVPPFQKSDEPSHYYRSVSLTNLDMTCTKDAGGGKAYFEIKRKYVDFPYFAGVWNVAFHYNTKFDFDWLRGADFSDPAFERPERVPDICNLSPVGYLPNALGILIGKPFQSPVPGFYLGRAFGALFFVGAIILALRVVPDRYRLLVYFYAAIPMVLHQVGAISYDAVHLSLFPLLFAYLAKFLVQEERIRPWELALFVVLILWTVNIRLFAYAGLVLLFFLIPPSKMAPAGKQYVRLAAAFLGVTVLVSGLVHLVYLDRSELLPPDAYLIDASAQTRFVIEHPWNFAAAAYRTMQIHGELLLRQGIGVFGWIDYAFNFLPYYLAVFLFGLLCYDTVRSDRLVLRPLQIVVLWGIIFVTVVSLFFSLYLVWSPVGAGVIGGLQGRYFVGLLPFAMLAASQSIVYLGYARVAKGLALVLVLFMLFSTFKAVYQRYY